MSPPEAHDQVYLALAPVSEVMQRRARGGERQLLAHLVGRERLVQRAAHALGGVAERVGVGAQQHRCHRRVGHVELGPLLDTRRGAGGPRRQRHRQVHHLQVGDVVGSGLRAAEGRVAMHV